MVSAGKVRLEDPVRIHTPDEILIAEHPGGAIALEHLATHTSGLDRMPANIGGLSKPVDYAEFGVSDLFDFLVHRRPPERPGVRCVYSNLGVALRGHALAHRHGGSFDAALSRWILDPLQMTSTSSEPLPEHVDRTATGHDVLAPVPEWNIPGLAPAGNLRTSLRDMLRFTESVLDPERTELGRDLAAGLPRRRDLELGGNVMRFDRVEGFPAP